MAVRQRASRATRTGDAWWHDTMQRLVSCRTVVDLLDLVYDAVRDGLDYDRVGVFLIDHANRRLVQRIGTDDEGHKIYPVHAETPLDQGVHGALSSDPRMQAQGPGFVFRPTSMHRDVPIRLVQAGEPATSVIYVALRTPDDVLGFVSVGNDREHEQITEEHAAPLVALTAACAPALRSAMQRDRRGAEGEAIEAVLRRRVAELELVREAGRRIHAASTLDAVLDAVYDGVRTGLGFDRVRIGLFDHAAQHYSQRRSTDLQGNMVSYSDRIVSLDEHVRFVHIPAVASLLRGDAFYYTSNAIGEMPMDLRYLFDGAPTHMLVAPLRAGTALTGLIAVDNATTGRPINPADAAPLLAIATDVELAVERVSALQQAQDENVRLRRGQMQARDARLDVDQVTGLLNHRALLERLDVAVASATPFTLLLLDIDNFKLFNDTYGHASGDIVLSEIATAIRHLCQEDDVAGRYGDDEFAVLLHSGAGTSAKAMLRRLDSIVRAHPHLTDDGNVIPQTISAGVAAYPTDGLTRQQLVMVAEHSLSVAKHGGRSVRQPQRARELLDDGHIGVLNGLVTAVDSKDRYTREHSEDVTRWALLLAESVGLDAKQRRVLALAGPLHDVGKIAVPDRVLRKPGKLTRQEYETMKHHVSFGVAIIQGVLHDEAVIDAVAHHHERWDGHGYPFGVTGLEAPLCGRIMQIADAVSAMRLNRPYRQGLPWTRIVSELRMGVGTQFDPDLVEPFIAAVSRARA